ncbi:sugar-binding protein [Jiangella alba]|uniref:NPCBM-associated, NEW3 domain of alpha-galactosidase n=1 Tax=Jiangella alba TaxID=561176 RepID=A0A1H5JJX2_9ACTN|nr:sugar-binding protein [Jiangella alba]SEE52873.1 NPCBM-associated, NEW3 domain of alpha-galactosidase [Jiangella alba]
MDVNLNRRSFLRGTGAVTAAAVGAAAGLRLLTPAERALAEPGGAVDLDILYIGAHPDDEAGTLGALGQWNEDHGVRAGVITITRGEGGGNAVGLEEGPPLGLLREAEERRAVAYAGIEHIYNLDGLDFYYTASAPLSEQIWGHESTLGRIVRVVRATRPSVIVTMNPSATDGNHGNHQQAAKLAVEAYYAAADPSRFPEHADEGFGPWRVGRILQSGAVGSGPLGPDGPATGYTPRVTSDVVFGTWDGTVSQRHGGERWSVVKTWAAREYITQGWSTRAFPPSDPARISSQWFTLIDTRTPYPDPRSGGLAAIEGAALQAPGGLPLGTEFYLETPGFHVLAGSSFEVVAHARAAARRPVPNASVAVEVPEGWTVSGDGRLGTLAPGRAATATFTVTVPADLVAGERFDLRGTLSTPRHGAGTLGEVVEIGAPVRGTLEPLPEIAQFRAWTAANGVEHLDSLILPLLAIGSGRGREVRVDLTNTSDRPQSGAVTLAVPAGFEVSPASRSYQDLAPGAAGAVTFTVTNTDPSLPTSNRAPDDGRYAIEIVTTYDGGSAAQDAAFLLVPSLALEKATTAPRVAGDVDESEFPGAVIDISTRWEGEQAPASDISGHARITYTDDAFYVYVNVTDDVLGFVLPPEDTKRQRRTDSVEINIDPRGTSANTSTVFIAGVFPITDDPANGNPPSFHRDRDNRQGPGPETAPGMEVASRVGDPYTGYTVVAKIPFDVLPDALDPQHVGFNILVNDSDTQDKSTQTRIGWSTWQGVRADPYRWAVVTLPDLAAQPSAPKEPVLPDTAAKSVDSPQSILQSAGDNVPLGGWRALGGGSVEVQSASASGGSVTARLRTRRAGQARVFVWDGAAVLGRLDQELAAGRHSVTVPLTASGSGSQRWLLVSLESGEANDAAAYRL